MDPAEILNYLRLARTLGLQTKAITSGFRPEGIEILLPYLHRLAISVDALEKPVYTVLRSEENYDGMMGTLDLLQVHVKRYPGLQLTALVMVQRSTLEGIEQRVTRIADLGLFHKIKLIEMLPIGRAHSMSEETLIEPQQLARLTRIRHTRSQVRIGVPLWRIQCGRRGCRLGSRYLVVGPYGELTGCALLLSLNHVLGNVRDISLEDAWQRSFTVFREKGLREVPSICHDCHFCREDLCWGGCPARRSVFGEEVERRRSCGIRCAADSERLYRIFREQSDASPKERFTIVDLETSSAPES